ncbi:MAG: hypothetical protein Q7R52_02375 [archaeon]|nr:hypothetical protein [archaeon]
MALNIISLNKFERTKEYHPNYIADIEFNGLFVKCDIYTNALLFQNGHSGVYATDHNYAKMNGNLYLKVESMTRFKVVNNNEIEREFRKMIKGNGLKKSSL